MIWLFDTRLANKSLMTQSQYNRIFLMRGKIWLIIVLDGYKSFTILRYAIMYYLLLLLFTLIGFNYSQACVCVLNAKMSIGCTIRVFDF